MATNFKVGLDPETKFLFSTSGSSSSIERYNTALSKLGLNLAYFTFGDAITPEVYAGLLRSPIARGGAVTGKGGLKSAIIPFLDEVEPLAYATLAVNTVVNKGGRLYGYNTDTFGLKTALLRGLKESGKDVRTAVIYGNGGVSGVAFRVLEEMGIRTTMVGRNPELVAKKKEELGIDPESHFDGPYDLLVDATPISSTPDFLTATGFEELVKGCKAVFCHNMPEKDGKANYLLEYCNRAEIFYIPGKWMHTAQLIKQYALFLDGYTQPGSVTPICEQNIIEAWGLTDI